MRSMRMPVKEKRIENTNDSRVVRDEEAQRFYRLAILNDLVPLGYTMAIANLR